MEEDESYDELYDGLVFVETRPSKHSYDIGFWMAPYIPLGMCDCPECSTDDVKTKTR